MAVQKSRKTPSKKGMKYAHKKLSNPTLSVDPLSGEKHLRHHVTKTGYYRGKKVVNIETVSDSNED